MNNFWKVAAVALSATLATSAQAGAVDVGSFSSAAISFGNPGPTATVAEGVTIGPVTFTDANSSSLIWWGAGNGYLDCDGGCMTTASYGVGSLDLALASGFNKVGLYVGQATGYSLDVSFYDAGNALLGTVTAAGAGAGVTFAGWESLSDIASIKIVNSAANSYVIAAQSGYFENGGAVPEPAVWAMMLGGFALVGGALRRRRTAISFA